MSNDDMSREGNEEDPVTLEASPDDPALFDERGFVIDREFNNFLDIMDDIKAQIGHHPASRSGSKPLVVFAEYNGESAWYDNTSEFRWME